MAASPLVPPAQQTIEEVFLTPRVLDRRAFEDYAGSLTRLIKDATGEGQALSRTAADVRVLKEQLAQAAGDAQKRLDQAVTLIASLEQRASGAGEAGNAAPGKGAGRRAEATVNGAAVGLNGAAAGGAAQHATRGGEAAMNAAVEERIKARIASVLDVQLESRLDAKLGERVEALVSTRIEQLVSARLERMMGQELPAVVADLVARGVEERLSGLDEHFERALSDRLRAIEERLESAEKAACPTAGDASGASAEASGAVLAEARAMVEGLRREVWSLVEEAREVAGRTASGSDATSAARESLERALGEAGERAAGLERTMETALRRFASEANEQGARLAGQTRDQIEKARGECEAAVRQITTGATLRVRKAQADVEELLGGLDRDVSEQIASARVRFGEALEAFTREGEERGAWLRAALAQVNDPRLAQLRACLDEARTMLDANGEGSLAGLIERATGLRAGVETNLTQIEDLSKQVGLMRDLLARSILEGVARIDDLDARVEELLASSARALERFGSEAEALRASLVTVTDGDASRAAHVLRSADQLSDGSVLGAATATEAEAGLTHVEARIDQLRAQMEEASQAAEWLAGLIDRAARAGITLDDAVTERAIVAEPKAKGGRRGKTAGTTGAGVGAEPSGGAARVSGGPGHNETDSAASGTGKSAASGSD